MALAKRKMTMRGLTPMVVAAEEQVSGLSAVSVVSAAPRFARVRSAF